MTMEVFKNPLFIFFSAIAVAFVAICTDICGAWGLILSSAMALGLLFEAAEVLSK